jgi:hypothetical protein
MDRPIVYVGELPRADDFLGLAKDALYGLGFASSAAIGPGTGVSGFAIGPTGPASLSFTIGAGSIYAPETVDSAAYGVLGTDSNNIIKQGILAAPVTLTITPPATSGYSQVYIVQVAYSDVDGGAIVPPYLNSANTDVPFNGAGGTGGSQNTTRQGKAVVQLKAGAAASTGSQATPSPDAGYTALWAITVANGATTITSANWTQLSANNAQYGAPWFPNLESLYSLFVPIIPATTFYVSTTGNDTTGNGTPAYPWATLTHAIAALSAYNLNGNTVTIQLSVGTYGWVGSFNAPSNGTLVIQGNASSQSSYVISGNPAVGNGVLYVSSGILRVVGVTIQNTSAGGSCILSSNSQVVLQNTSFQTTVAGSQALVAASTAGSVQVQAGCIMSGSANAMWNAFDGGTIIQAANCTTTSSPAYAQGCMIASNGGQIGVSTTGLSWFGTGSASGKGAASTCGVINSAGSPSFWPGSAAVTTSSGGQSV